MQVSKRITYYVVQPFEISKGRLKAGQARQASSQDNAIRLAHRLGAEGGAIAFSRTGDPQWDEWDDAVIIARVGEVPEELELAA